MQVLDTPFQSEKDNLELYLLQLKANSVALIREMNVLNAAVKKEIRFIENLIEKIKNNNTP